MSAEIAPPPDLPRTPDGHWHSIVVTRAVGLMWLSAGETFVSEDGKGWRPVSVLRSAEE